MAKYIGVHVSTEGGVFNAAKNAFDINAKAFALFVKNQRQWVAKPLNNATILNFKESLTTYGFKPEYILPHAGYLINLGSPNSENRKKSIKSFIDELSRCSNLGLKYLNIHPGSHLNEISEDECINLIADSIEQSIDAVKNVKIVLENTAGQGSNIGYKFEHLAQIIEKIKNKSRVGVCIDTCHTFAAGYDIKDPKKYKETMKKFEDIIGLEYLTGMHLNDSKVPFASRKDRHENIGKGFLGLDFFKRFINDLRFDNMPIILETIDETLWKDEIALLYSMTN
jgi:deoxyribonuclease-4